MLVIFNLLLFIITVYANTESIIFTKSNNTNNTSYNDIILGYQELNISFNIQSNKLINNQVELLKLNTNNLIIDNKYTLKLSWCSINPIDIKLNYNDENQLIEIEIKPNYYTTTTTNNDYLHDIQLNIQLLHNNKLFNLLNDELISIIVYISSILIGCLTLLKFIEIL
ncbi:hypothetical protein CANARDRAFT_9464 [[Candida] arabinofermentans NRRL YB-2248]|uniref:Uncharacterized protein n=1 Tax=[Candida] arabinofermentans NRRL YB-2248 TaxID=983967 RepID=A0A1E4SVW1_9ASCO|nr:hypothetical protein CANARDRAFT_9464 [[Candida] arabinofermentans NRRL YB-2248]